jgi:hypothetical protein
MGMKFEYTRNPLLTHWDADYVVSFDRVSTILSRAGRPCKVGEADGWAFEVPATEDTPWLTSLLRHFFMQAVEKACFPTGHNVLLIQLPDWAPTRVLVSVWGELAKRRVWEDYDWHNCNKEVPPGHKFLMNIRLLCPNEEIFDGMAAYFQGTWEL